MGITTFAENNYITHDISSVFYLPIGQNFGGQNFGRTKLSADNIFRRTNFWHQV